MLCRNVFAVRMLDVKIALGVSVARPAARIDRAASLVRVSMPVVALAKSSLALPRQHSYKRAAIGEAESRNTHIENPIRVDDFFRSDMKGEV